MCNEGFVAQALVAGSYSSTASREPLSFLPPTAYSLPFGAAANPRLSRGIDIGGRFVQVSATGSYSSTVERSAPFLPPTAYSLPFGAAARPRPSRAVFSGALAVQVLEA